MPSLNKRTGQKQGSSGSLGSLASASSKNNNSPMNTNDKTSSKRHKLLKSPASAARAAAKQTSKLLKSAAAASSSKKIISSNTSSEKATATTTSTTFETGNVESQPEIAAAETEAARLAQAQKQIADLLQEEEDSHQSQSQSQSHHSFADAQEESTPLLSLADHHDESDITETADNTSSVAISSNSNNNNNSSNNSYMDATPTTTAVDPPPPSDDIDHNGNGNGNFHDNNNTVSVQAKNLLQNFRLSRGFSRVLSPDETRASATTRSPSPSRKLLAAEIAVAAAVREAAGPQQVETPPLEQTPLLMMRFTEKATPKLVSLVEQRLKKCGLIVYDKVACPDQGHTYVYLTAAQEALETLAEQVRWMKRTNDTKVVEYFTVLQKRKFVAKSKRHSHAKKRRLMKLKLKLKFPHLTDAQLESQLTADADILSSQDDYNNGMGGDDLFTSNEWCHLAFRLLDAVEVWLSGESSNELNLMLMLKEENEVPMDLSMSGHSHGHMSGSSDGSHRMTRSRSAKASRTNSKDRSKSPASPSSRRGGMDGKAPSWQQSTFTFSHDDTEVPSASASSRRMLKRQNTEGPSRAAGLHRRRKDLDHQESLPLMEKTPSSKLAAMRQRGDALKQKGSSQKSFDRRSNFHRQKSIRNQNISPHGKRSTCLRHVLEANDYVDIVTPIHWGPARDAIRKQTMNSLNVMPPVQEMRNYYGEDVAFYFAWMGLLAQWLMVLGVMGCFTSVVRHLRNDTIDTDEFTPMYGLFTFVWGVLFLRFWERHEHRLAYRWGTYSLSLFDKHRQTAIRPQFQGKLRISPVTGEYETYYPSSRRRLQYFLSALVTIVMLSVAFFMMILSLNMQGYIHPERNPERWNPNNPHPFHYPMFAGLSEQGQLFDSKHAWRGLIPTFIHVAMVFTLNSCYRGIAERLTDWENHETEASYRNSLILKRFLFEAFDCYVSLFYLAFYERDVDRLHIELKTVFNIDTFRRLTMECFIPLLSRKVSKLFNTAQVTATSTGSAEIEIKTPIKEMATTMTAGTSHGEEASPASVTTASTSTTTNTAAEREIVFTPSTESANFNATADASDNTTEEGEIVFTPDTAEVIAEADYIAKKKGTPTLQELVEEAEKDEYEQFDDYMEIVIQFGYVTLFASAYPMASLVAFLANMVEIRSDCFKLAKVCRRPRSFRADGIGIWKSLLSCIVWMSALTNCLIVGFTSDQMKEIFPAFYMVDTHGDTHLVHDKGWIAVFVIFGLERIMIVIGLLIYAIVPSTPEDVHNEIERLHFVRAQEHEAVMRRVMKRRSNKKKV